MLYTEIPTQRPVTPLLDAIDHPEQLRALEQSQLEQVADELRQFILYAAGQSGGYLLTFGNTGNVTYGINKLSLGNPNLGWETTEAWNLGFESSWFNNRIQLDVDAYVSNTFDELFTRTIPVMTGFGSMLSSMGKVRNTGFEITLRTKNVDTNNFKWNSMLTFWLNRDKLIHLYGDDMNGDGKEDDDVANGLFIGKSIHSIYGVKQIGIVQGSDADYIKANGVKAGTPKYEDHDHDGVITVNDRYVIGNTNPNFKLNFSTNSRDRSKWSSLGISSMSCSGIYDSDNST